MPYYKCIAEIHQEVTQQIPAGKCLQLISSNESTHVEQHVGIVQEQQTYRRVGPKKKKKRD